MKRLLLITLMLAMVLGCKKKNNAVKGGTVQKNATAEFTLTKGIDGVIGIRNLKKFETLLGNLAGKINPAIKTQLDAQMEMGLRSLLGVADLKFLDHTKTIYLLGVRSQKNKLIPVLVIPFTDDKAFDAALPQGKTPCKTVKGAYKFQSLQGSFVYVLKAGNKLAEFAFDDPSVLNTATKFVPSLKLYKVNKPLTTLISSASLSPLIDKSFNQAMAKIKKQKMSDTLKKEMALIKDLVTQTKTLALAMDYVGGNLILDVGMTLKKGSDLSEVANGSLTRSFKLAGNLPPKGWMVMTSNVKLNKLSMKWMELGVDTWKEMLGLNAEEAKELHDQYMKLIKLSNGESAFSMFDKDGMPLSMVSITGTKQGKATYDTMRTLAGNLFSKIMTKSISLSKSDKDKKLLTSLNLASVKDFVASANKLTTEKGVDLTYSPLKEGGYTGEMLTAKVDYTKLPKDANMLKQFTGDKVGSAWGYNKSSVIFTFGKAPVAILKDAQKSESKDMVLKTIIENYKGHSFTAGYIAMGKLVSMFQAAVPPLAPMLKGLGGADKLMVKFVFGTKDPTHITGTVNLPYDDIALIVKKLGPLLGRRH